MVAVFWIIVLLAVMGAAFFYRWETDMRERESEQWRNEFTEEDSP